MRIEVVGRNLEVTDAIRQHAEEKAEKLRRFYDGLQQVTWTLEMHPRASGEEFEVELILDVEHHDDFVTKEKGHNLYALIDDVHHKGIRQLKEFNERLKVHKRH